MAQSTSVTKLTVAQAFRVVDYTLGFFTVGYGIYVHSPLYIGAGVAGLALAYVNISDQLSQKLQKYFTRKKVKPTTTLVTPAPSIESLSISADNSIRYTNVRLIAGPTIVSNSRHSLFKAKQHLNHYTR